MKDPEDIQHVYEELGNLIESQRWRGDNFQFGLYKGKLLALGWVLGLETMADMRFDSDFEDWTRMDN
jgi:hypothetical protein